MSRRLVGPDGTLDLLSERGELLVVDKPAGRLSHGRGGVLEQVRREVGGDWRLGHRLDRETSGCLLLARGAPALRQVHDGWPSVSKVYLAILLGTLPDAGEGRVETPILEHHSDRPELLARALRAGLGAEAAERLLAGESLPGVPPIPPPARSALHPFGRPAATGWTRIAGRGDLSLVELRPENGRMHQLRLHARALGAEILGDSLYGSGGGKGGDGDVPGDPGRLALHVARLDWPGAPGGGLAVAAPLPDDLARIARWIAGGDG